MTMPPFRLSFREPDANTRRPREVRRGARPPCCAPGCDSESHTRGMCQAHYHRMWRKKDAPVKRRVTVREPNQECEADGCKNKCRTMGLCGDHYFKAFLLVRSTGTSFEEVRRNLLPEEAVEPIRMDTGELRIDYIRRRAAAMRKEREVKKKKASQKQKKESQKYDYLANVVNQNDTEWGDESYD